MAEHVLRGEIVIYPRELGGRQFLLNDTGEIYRIPLDEENVKIVIEQLSKSDEDLVADIERREAGKRLQHAPGVIVPNGAGG